MFTIGYPFILIEVQQRNCDEDDDEVKEPRRHEELPIGHPSVLMILSCVMWTMWTVGMFLARLGFQWSSFAARAYWEMFHRKPKSLPPPRKPPDKHQHSKKTRMMLVGLQVALRIAVDIPDITLQHDKALRTIIRRNTKGGRLNTLKLSSAQRERIFEAVNQMPQKLMTTGDVRTLIIDTGASGSVTGDKSDFIPGTLKLLKHPIHHDGIGGCQHATHTGITRYETFDDKGDLVELKHQTHFVPGINCRLFSPQSFYSWIRQNGGGEKGNGEHGFHSNGSSREIFDKPLETFHDRSCLHLPGGKTLTIPHDKISRLPLLHCFKDAVATSQTLAMSCVSDELNQNLTHLQKLLLQWHFRLGHIGFQWLQWVARQGFLGPQAERAGTRKVDAPKCAACQFGKQQRNPKPGSRTIRDVRGALKQNKVRPGQLVFSDQFESRLPGRVFNARGSTVHSQQMIGGTLFCDAASSRISVHSQVSLSASDTIASKLKFERDALSVGVRVDSYCTDNGVCTSRDFLDELQKENQTIRLSGVGGHHQNGVAENAIKNVVRTARTMMIHAALRWPEHFDKKLWPMALQHAVFLHNHVPRQDSGMSPKEIWSGTKSSHSRLMHSHPWGCPVCVLDPRMQDGQKLPKWEPQSRRAQHLGCSPLHASTVGLVRNLTTGNMSPQFHLVFDDWFETVHASGSEEPKEWQELIQFQRFSNDFDDEQFVPELGKEWLNQEELATRETRERQRREQGQRNASTTPMRDTTESSSPQREQAPTTSQQPDLSNEETAQAAEPQQTAPGDSQQREQPPVRNYPRRERKQPEVFTQNKECGCKLNPRTLRAQSKSTQHSIAAVANWTKRMIKVVVRH